MEEKRNRIRGVHRGVQDAARELRKTPTEAERLLWTALRQKQIAGVRFRRQHPLGRFILDFCAPDLRLVIEVDGGIHAQTAEYDAERTDVLTRCSYRVVRFTNQQVIHNLTEVTAEIRRTIQEIRKAKSDNESR